MGGTGTGGAPCDSCGVVAAGCVAARAAPRHAPRMSRLQPRTRLKAALGDELLILGVVHDVKHRLLLFHFEFVHALAAPTLACGLQLGQNSGHLGTAALHIAPGPLHGCGDPLPS